MKYNDKLVEIRKRLGMTQIVMAETLGVKQSSISMYEIGECYPCAKVRKKYLELAKRAKVNLTLEELLRD